MRRRQFLLAAGVALLPGCSDAGTGETPSAPSTDAPTPTTAPTPGTGDTDTDLPARSSPSPSTPTPTWSPGGTARLGPGSTLVRLTVEEGYDGEVVLGGACSGEDLAVATGESIAVERETAGEGCAYTVSLNGSVEHRDGVSGYETARVTVTVDGTVEASTLAT
jgi:hypothetical protein